MCQEYVKTENDPKAVKKDEFEKVIKKVKENMPEPLAKKEYSVIDTLESQLEKRVSKQTIKYYHKLKGTVCYGV